MTERVTYIQGVPLQPDVPGRVRGIISVDPPRIQCTTCGLVAQGAPGKLGLLVLLARIGFYRRRGEQPAQAQRLCDECARAQGFEVER